jgi:alpha-glucosidase
MAKRPLIHRLVLAARALGVRNMLRAVRYGVQKSRLERAWRDSRTQGAPGAGPGVLLEALPVERGARFRFERAELEVLHLAPDLVRISWGPAAEPVPYALARIATDWPVQPVQCVERPEAWIVSGPDAAVEVSRDGALALRDGSGATLRKELPPELSGAGIVHRVELRTDVHLFGLGERAGPAERRGRRFRMWNRDPGGEYGDKDDPLYIGIPAYLGVHSTGSYLVFYENAFDALFDLGDSQPDLALHRFEGGMLRYYLAAGSPDRTLARFLELTGRPPLPPLWALGYHQSRYSYFPESRVRRLVEDFERHAIPLDAVHLDIHHMDRYRSFTWDPQRFPDPRRLASDLAAKGIRLVAIVDQGIEQDPRSSRFRDGLEKKVFCRDPDGSTVIAPLWPGWAAFPDFTDASARAWWAEQYQGLVEAGVAGIWNDMNEPTAFSAFGDTSLPLPTRHAFEVRGGDHREAHNLYGLLEVRATREGLLRLAPDRRPFILSRSGWAGLQRHAWSWTGDVKSDWPSLRQVVPMVLGLSLSGVLFTGPDIGGFNGTPTPELFTRWLQLGAFLPFCRAHTVIGSPDQEPFSYGEPWLSINRAAIETRYALLPYLYTLAWQAHAQGAPLVRPLWWPEAAEPRLLGVDDTFLLGPSLLVAPVLEAGALERAVELPPGRWYDLHSGGLLPDQRQARLSAPLERIPVLVRAGAVLPRLPPARNTAAIDRSRLALHLYAPEEGHEGVSLLHSDAGDGPERDPGPSRLDRFRLRHENGRLLLGWDFEGAFPWPHREVELIVHSSLGQEQRRMLREPVPETVFDLSSP